MSKKYTLANPPKIRAYSKYKKQWFDPALFAHKTEGKDWLYQIKFFFSRLNHFKPGDIELYID